MSSGACRALVAVVLTLVATIVMTLPVAAESEDLVENSIVTYNVSPESGEVKVSIAMVLQTGQAAWQAQDWGPIVIENAVPTPRVSKAAKLKQGGTDVPGSGAPWRHIDVRTQKIAGGRETKTFQVSYTIDAQGQDGYDVPARVDESYVFLCVPGQEVDSHRVSINVGGGDWVFSQSGTPLEVSGNSLSGTEVADPAGAFTCIEGVRVGELEKAPLIGPGDREIQLQAWASDSSWLSAAAGRANPALDAIWQFLGHDIPGEGTVVIREAPAPEAGGYAGAHDIPGVVSLSETVGAGTQDVEHQMAHAWFGKDNVNELWLREGIAEWIASSVTGDVCAPVSGNASDLNLRQWQLLVPTAPPDYATIIEDQAAAACGIVSAVVERMPLETFKQEVLGSLLIGETKYNGTAGPESGASLLIDYREFLDAVDERGLVPAAKADPTYAGNLTDLDFAQNLLDEYGIPPDLPLLQQRSEARAMYHEFLDNPAGFGAPHTVRKHMDDWEFEEAMQRIEQSNKVYANLAEANRLLPEADLMPIVQPQFEAAEDAQELDAVTELVLRLREGAEQLVVPLGDLSDALPPGWNFPVAVNAALRDQRFDDVMPAITPAIAAAQSVSEANEFLPQAGLLEKYQVRFENTATTTALDQLAADARSDRRNASLASYALAELQNVVGDWNIPDAVTRPLEQGQLEVGLKIVEDATAVIVAARNADLKLARAADLGLIETGLREEVQPLFEGVSTGAEMAALREEIEARGGAAAAVGDALGALNMLVPDWQIPAVIAEPVAAGDYFAAVEPAETAAEWVKYASQANEALAEINALEEIRNDFESATDLATLTNGVEIARLWAQAANEVSLAIEKAAQPRDMITRFGLWGVNVEPQLEEAKQAVIDGDLQTALSKAADVIKTIDGGSSAGSLRLAGIVFFGVAVIGVAGLWLMLRRQAGPSWARSTKPHWVEEEEKKNKRGLLGRGKAKDDGKKQDGR